MNTRAHQSDRVPARLAWWLLVGSALVVGAATAAFAQEERAQPAGAPDTAAPAEPVPQTTPETTTQQATDPAAGVVRRQGGQESEEAGTLERPAADDDRQVGALPSPAGEYEENDALRDAWLDGKLEVAYALNRRLNPFTIDTRVENGTVYLTGHVESEIDRELAGHVAENIDGVTAVRNDLSVQPGDGEEAEEPGTERDLAQRIEDVTTTAMVKSRLLINDQTHGLRIDVDTIDQVVTLSGDASSDAERELAAQIAGSVEEVDRVQNELRVVDTRQDQE